MKRNCIKQWKRNCLALVPAVLLLAPRPSFCDPPEISGGGNFTTGDDEKVAQSQFAALRSAGAQAIRLSVYPYNYFDGEKPVLDKMNQQILEVYKGGVKKMLLQFEFDASYPKHGDAPNQIGDYDKWFQIGQAFAGRYSPNSAWLKSQGIIDWGITIFEAFNEPDDAPVTHMLPISGPSSYYTSLKGLADGVHSVDPKLAVIPGGFAKPDMSRDFTMQGYGPALAPLWNDGTLDGIDLHIYNDIKYAPIIGTDGSPTPDFAPQVLFDEVKKACHITRDINFYTTEYNFKANEQGIDEDLAAKRLLTCIWANLGVVKNDGKTPATQLALVWNLFNTTEKDKTYGVNSLLDPWTPTARGKTFQMVMSLTAGMNFTSLDPKGRGEFVLEGQGKKLWIWQNYQHWTNVPGSSFSVTDIPGTATKLDVYDWSGLQKSYPLSAQNTYTVTDLKPNETFMFLASSDVATNSGK
jgi:hypothetical protein